MRKTVLPTPRLFLFLRPSAAGRPPGIRPPATATANVDLFALSVPVGKRYVVADGSPFDLSAASLIRGGRTYVPLRSFANLLGVEVNFVNWNVPVALSTGKAASYTDDDLYWLSLIISAESQGESLTGQIAVGNVVLNRVASSQFPNTIRAVIFDTKDAVQFEPTAQRHHLQGPHCPERTGRQAGSERHQCGGGLHVLLQSLPVPGDLDPPELHLLYHHRLPPVLSVACFFGSSSGRAVFFWRPI